MKIIDNETGEIIEKSIDDNAMVLANNELTNAIVFIDWMEARDRYLMAKEQFESVDAPFKKKVKELFDKYSIKSIKNDYMNITLKNGYLKETWDDEKIEQLIYDLGLDEDNFKNTKWIDGSIQIKYKG